MTDQDSTPSAGQGASTLAFDEYELDLPRFELRCRGEVVPLEPQVFEVLAYLARNADRVVPKDELLDKVWPERYVTDGVLNSRVMTARKAIGDSGQAQRYIKTIHGRGYRFVGDVQSVAVSAPQPPTMSASAPVPLRVEPRPWAPSLVVPATSFVGRGEEMGRLRQLLAHSGCRLVSIVGPGGVGKTRLAMELANLTAAAGRPTAFVSLEAITEPREIPAAVAAALGLALRSEDPPSELLTYLASRQEAIVLDNFEQLLEAAPFLHDMLATAPGITLVVTSRAVLGLAEEWILRVSGLPVSSEGDSAAMRLFFERAAQANAWAAAPSPEEIEQAREICELVDGMPLAIELAASLTRYLPSGEIAGHIRKDISVLSSDLRVAPGRHRSIPVLLEESCRHLPAEERSALEALAVFEGQFTADAAGQVADAPLTLVRTLVDRSLVQAGQGSFSLHPLMRQFASERLGERAATLRERHAEYYAALAESLVPALEGGGQVAATHQVDEHFLNFAAAWRWAAEHRRLDLLDRAAYPLSLALVYRGRYFDAHELLHHAIAAAREGSQAGRELLAMLLTSRAWVLFRFGRGGDAARDVNEALTIHAAEGLQPRAGVGLDPRLALTVLYHGGGDYAKAYETAMAVLEEALGRGEHTAIAFASWIGGSARLRQARLVWERRADGSYAYAPVEGDLSDGAVEEADRLQRAARAVLKEMGDTWLSAFVEIELGLVSASKGSLEDACEHFRHAYELRRAFNDPQGMASAQVYLAGTLIDLGRLDEADALHAAVLELAASIGDSNNLAEVERSMAVAAIARGNCALAFQHARLALQRSLAMGFTNNVASIIGSFGRIFLAIREPARAAECFAVIVAHPASTPFSRARAEGLLDSLSGTLSPRTIADIRRRAARLDLSQATAQAVATLDQMEERVLAASREAGWEP